MPPIDLLVLLLAQDLPERVAGNDPLLWALVGGLSSLAAVLVYVFRLYVRSRDEYILMMGRHLEAMHTSVATLGATVEVLKDEISEYRRGKS